METNKKIIIGVFSLLLVGVALVSASSMLSMNQLHQKMIASDDFEQMHAAMIRGDFEVAESYHSALDFECPMHELVKNEDVSLNEFQIMHRWMMTGDFPKDQPEEISDATWELHTSHHPELYG